MRTLVCLIAVVAWSVAARAKPAAKPAPTTAAAKKIDRASPDAIRDIDYVIIQMGYIYSDVVKRKSDEARREIAERQAAMRDKVRVFEKIFDVTLMDKDWKRCCDDYNPLTGEIRRGGFDELLKQQAAQQKTGK